MDVALPRLDIDRLREEILGCDFRFRTPFGERRMVYADYTASGRGVRFIEDHLVRIQESYANTHTEDDVTGRSTTRMLHHAEDVIKRSVNGDADTRIIAVGTGATGAIKRLQEILGVYIPPATRAFLEREGRVQAETTGVDAFGSFMAHIRLCRPVVFVGPYEHHSNEVSWRESLAEVVEIGLAPDGGLDMVDLDRKAGDPRYEGRFKIGSLSAASNVTGMRTPVYDAARILHRHGALACFDFAACAPYVTIDMNRDSEAYFDAVFFSPHKFLGGPGTSGLLLFNRRIYRDDLPPTFASGGTVDYVGPDDQDYTADIETREKPGTPGTLQLLKAMLAIELKEAIGQDVIEGRERDLTRRMMERLLRHPGIEVLGNPDPDRRIGIVSFNLRHKDRYLHPKLVTRLLNDLFGIQSRAGCSCAGPYGHRLLNIGPEESHRYRDAIHAGCQGIKPGWVRLSLHYCMDDEDVDYIGRAVEFLAEVGHLFLPLYRFDMATGAWCHEKECGGETPRFGIREALAASARPTGQPSADSRKDDYARYFAEAEATAARLRGAPPPDGASIPGLPEDLVYFQVIHLSAGSPDEPEP